MYKRTMMLMGTVVFMTTGALVIMFAANITSTVVLIAGLLVGGLGYVMLFLLWLELFGCVRTQDALIGFAFSYLVNFLIWALLQNISNTLQFVLVFASPFVSLAMLISGHRKIPSEHRPTGIPEKTRIPWKLLLWVGAFAFAYGAGDGITKDAFSSLSSRIGMALPEIVILFGLIFAAGRFDFKALYRTVIPCMIIGFSLASIGIGNAIVSQVLMSAANESYLILAHAVIWAISYRLRCSAAMYLALNEGINIAMLQIGIGSANALRTSVSDVGVAMAGLGVVVIALVLVASIFVFREQDYVDVFVNASPHGAKGVLSNDELASTYGLSQKEKAVLYYLAKGYSATEIAEEMFLAPSTIRAHTSRIYQKLGIHSRRELNEMLVH
jgi:DNA-binding CsgD family transcriptional regulator